jgi:glutathione S-transferase
MNNNFILHHYDASPYAEKIRLMFGLTGGRWQSLRSPVQPPRPNLDPLTGGYRRIPVAQLGADIFCDTALIAREVAGLTRCAVLDPTTADAEAARLMELAEKRVFFAAITAVPPLRLLGTMLHEFGPVGTYRFVKDRAGILKGGTTRPPKAAAGKAILTSFLDELEATLSKRRWVGGDAASVADFAAYHPLWLHVSSNRRPLACGPRVQRWYQAVGDIGHGQREEITQAQAFTAARDSEPRPLPASVENPPIAMGGRVSVAPSDYGTVPVTGVLAAVTEDRIVIARDTTEFGRLHVHFPRAGYSLRAA